MGTIPPALKANTRVATPGVRCRIHSIQKERINMQSVIRVRRAPTERVASHFFQVYRPLDNENLKSEEVSWATPLQSWGCLPQDGFSTPHLFHEECPLPDNPTLEMGP
jgi:hypothetical protein